MINYYLPIRVLQTALAITTLGFNSYVTHWYLSHTHPSICPDEPLFLIAVACWTLLTMPYLMFNAPLQITHRNRTTNPRFFNKHAVLALDLISCLLWFGSWIALAIFRSQLILCGGHVCGFMGWGAGVGAVAAITYTLTATLAGLHVLRTRGNKSSAHAAPAPVEQNHEAWVGMGMQQKA